MGERQIILLLLLGELLGIKLLPAEPSETLAEVFVVLKSLILVAGLQVDFGKSDFFWVENVQKFKEIVP